MALGHSPKFVTDGLQLCLDAANPKSYPGSGTTWVDLSGNGNTGTLTNGPTYSSGSIVFDGTNDYIIFSLNSSLNFLGILPYTLQAWVYPTSAPGYNTYKGIINREGTYGGLRDGYNLWCNQDINGNIRFASERFFSGSSAGVGYTQSQAATIGVWSFLNVVYNGTALILYLNGVQVGSTNTASNITNDTKVLEIGSRSLGSNIAAKIPHCAIYNRALTAAEIQQNFNAYRGRYGI